MSIVVFFLILGALVLIHEFGHYIIAKKNNVLVEEFGIGFPPRLWGKKIGETLYSINLIPLGGFVKLHGEEYSEIKEDVDTKSLKKRAFVFQKPHIKAAIITGGVIMNLILGVTIYYIILSLNGFQSEAIPLLKPYRFLFGSQQERVVVTAVQKDSPAEKAHLSSEDLVMKYQISPIMYETAWKSVGSASELISIIKNSQGRSVFLSTVSIKNGVTKTVQVIPQYDSKLKRAIIGIGLIDTVIISYHSPIQKLFSGFLHSYNIMTYNYSTIATLFQTAVKEKNAEIVSGVVSGPIGIFSVVSDIVKTSGKKLAMNILNITALLSLSLAFMNILPFPALDGGRFVFVLYEWITKKRINSTIEQYANLGGFIFLIFLAIVVSINDIMRFFR